MRYKFHRHRYHQCLTRDESPLVLTPRLPVSLHVHSLPVEYRLEKRLHPIPRQLRLMSGIKRYLGISQSIHGLLVESLACWLVDGIGRMLFRILKPNLADSRADQDESSHHKVYGFIALLKVSFDRRAKILASPHHI